MHISAAVISGAAGLSELYSRLQPVARRLSSLQLGLDHLKKQGFGYKIMYLESFTATRFTLVETMGRCYGPTKGPDFRIMARFSLLSFRPFWVGISSLSVIARW
jgi:hypothetical protein